MKSLYNLVSYSLVLSGNVSKVLGATLARLKKTQMKFANFSGSFKTTLNAALLVITTLHIPTSKFLSVALTSFRMVSQA